MLFRSGGGGVGLAVLHGGGHGVGCRYGGLGGVEVGLFLELADVFLVADSLVAEPVGDLREGHRGSLCVRTSDRHCALSSVIASRCHVWLHQVPNSQPTQ